MVIFYSSVKLPEGTTKTVDETLVLPWHGPWPWIWWCWVYIITIYTQVWCAEKIPNWDNSTSCSRQDSSIPCPVLWTEELLHRLIDKFIPFIKDEGFNHVEQDFFHPLYHHSGQFYQPAYILWTFLVFLLEVDVTKFVIEYALSMVPPPKFYFLVANSKLSETLLILV